MRHLEVQPQQVPHLLKQRDDLRIKVHSKLEPPAPQADDLKETSVDAHVASVDVVQPCIVHGPGIELLAESGTFGLELLALGVQFPSLTEDVFDALHVGQELPFDLARPDDGACYRGQVAHLGHVVSFGESVLGFELCFGFVRNY